MLKRKLAAALGLAALAMGLAACGSSSESDTSATTSAAADTTAAAASTTSSAAKPTGEPIKVMTIAPIHSQAGGTYENIAVTAQTYEKFINDQGGINGRPLQVEVCDDQNDPNKSAFCAQQAQQHGDVAVVGSGSVNGDRIVPILQKADIAYFGDLAYSPLELTSKVSFPTGSPIVSGVGTGAVAANNCENAGYVAIQGGGAAADALHKLGYAAYGKAWKTEVQVPYTATDYSPQVAQVTSGTDCVDLAVTESVLQRWMPPFAQANSTQRLIGTQGNLDDKVCKGFEASCKDALAVDLFPPLSDPVWDGFRAALDKYGASKELEYNSLGALNGWASFTIFTNIVKGMKGDITSKAFLDAANATSDVDSEGMTAPLDFTKEWDVPGMNRIFTRSVRVDEFQDGSFKPKVTEWIDLTPLFTGKPVEGFAGL